jgi:hypothetical protein
MKTEKQLTAVEQLEKQILDNWMGILTGKVYIGDLFEQAKAMEKEKIVNAWDNSTSSGDYRSGKEYYEETFKQQEQ